MNILKSWKKKILFGYYCYPAEEWPEMENAGFSVRLFANGTLIYQTYSLDRKREPVIATSQRLCLNENSVRNCAKIIQSFYVKKQCFSQCFNEKNVLIISA